MNIEKIQQLNITTLFKNPLNHSAILAQDIFNVIGIGPQPIGASVIQGPGVLAITLTKQQKELIFEINRILINDKGGNIDGSEIIADYSKITKMPFFNKENVVAYGFNYDILGSKIEGINFSDYVADSVKKIVADKLESAGVKLNFKRGNISYELQIVPTGVANQAIVHLNVHFPVAELSGDESELKGKFKEKFNELKTIVDKL